MFDEEHYQHRCSDCGALSPPISEGDTFLSTRFGWRLHRYTDERNELRFEWRCPDCWAKFKASRGGEGPPPRTTSQQAIPRSTPGSYSVIPEPSKSRKLR
jgi:DNA-directed RNA polymerase subunit RPC12/RpoP